MQIIFTVLDDKANEFRDGFLAAYPIPEEDEDTPVMTEKEWIKEWGKQRFVAAYQKGKKLLAEGTAQIDEEII